jgi:BolA family transcriptional regulator, general stress-responsive regulator
MSCQAKIEAILTKKFNPQTLIVTDESAKHADHRSAVKNGGGHFRIEIVAEAFRGLAPLARHRKIYDCLYPQLKNEIHALAIKASAP